MVPAGQHDMHITKAIRLQDGKQLAGGGTQYGSAQRNGARVAGGSPTQGGEQLGLVELGT